VNLGLVWWRIRQCGSNVEAGVGVGRLYLGLMRIGYRSYQTKVQMIASQGASDTQSKRFSRIFW
jgi:hypothetical protein